MSTPPGTPSSEDFDIVPTIFCSHDFNSSTRALGPPPVAWSPLLLSASRFWIWELKSCHFFFTSHNSLSKLEQFTAFNCDVISTQQRFFASLMIDGVNFPFISLMLSVTPCTNTSISSFDQLGFSLLVYPFLGGQTTKRCKHGNTYRACAYETKVSCQESFLS